MDRQTTLAFVLIGVILVSWLYFNSPQPVENPEQTTTQQIEEPKAQSQEVEITPKEIAKVKKVDSLITKKNPEEIITVESDLFRIELSTYGGNIHKFFLKDYFTWYNVDLPEDAPWFKKYIQLINFSRGNELNLSFLTKSGKLINTEELEFIKDVNNNYFKIEQNDSLTLTFTFNFDESRSIQKIFTFYGNNYESNIRVQFNNLDDYLSGENYDLIWKNGINFVEKDATQEATYSTGNAFTGGEIYTIDIPGNGEVNEKSINGSIDWIGVKNKYFGFLIAPNQKQKGGGAYFKSEKIITEWGERVYNTVSLKVPFKNLDNQNDSFSFFGGPLQYNLLKDYNRNYESLVDFGSVMGLRFIIRPISEYFLLPLFVFLHSFIPNYGIVIIIFSILIKLLLYPLTKKSYESMKRMQLLQPEITALKEKYKDDKQRVQKETMNLYSKFGVNPAGGCMPMVLQMPILFALFAFFRVVVELRQQPFVSWISNLSEPDIIFELPYKIPILGLEQFSGLAILLGITMFLQQKMTMKDPSQKAMVYIMPVMFTLMFMSFSSGLNLYYFMFNLLSIIQQYAVNKGGIQKLEVVEPKKRKKGFMTKMMEAAEQQQKSKGSSSSKKRNKK